MLAFKLDMCWQEAGWRPLLDGQHVSDPGLYSHIVAGSHGGMGSLLYACMYSDDVSQPSRPQETSFCVTLYSIALSR